MSEIILKFISKPKCAKSRLLAKIKRYKKVGLQVSIAIFIVFSAPAFVYSDSFYPNGDSNSCSLAAVVGIQYSRVGGGDIYWDSSNVQGEVSPWIQNSNFKDIASPWYPNASRKDFVADIVALPPGSRVEFGAYFWNHSGHTVNVNRIDLYTSLDNINHGDLTRLGADGIVANSCFKINGGINCRNSKTVPISLNWSIVDRNVSLSDTYGRIFYGFDLIQPIQPRAFEQSSRWDGQNFIIDYSIRLANVSDYSSCDINIKDQLPNGTTFDSNYCIGAHSQITVNYSANMGRNTTGTIINDPATITDRNFRQESITYVGSSIYDRTSTVLPAIIYRNDSNATGWYSTQPTWGEMGRPLTVILIPYWFYTQQLVMQAPQDVKIEAFVTDSDQVLVEQNNIGNAQEMVYTVKVTNSGEYINNLCVNINVGQEYFDVEIPQQVCISELFHGATQEITLPIKLRKLPVGDYFVQAKFSVDYAQNSTDFVDTNISAYAKMDYDLFLSDDDELMVKENSVQGLSPDEFEREITFELFYNNTGNADYTTFSPILDLSGWGDIISIKSISDNGFYDSANFAVIWPQTTVSSVTEGKLTVKALVKLPNEQFIFNSQNADKNISSYAFGMEIKTVILYPSLTFSVDGEYNLRVENNGQGTAYNLSLLTNIDLPNGFTISPVVNNLSQIEKFLPGDKLNISYEILPPTRLPMGESVVVNNFEAIAFGYKSVQFTNRNHYDNDELEEEDQIIKGDSINEGGKSIDVGDILGISTRLAKSGQSILGAVLIAICGIIITRRKFI